MRLVQDVLERSRLEEGSRPLQLRRGHLGAYVHDLAEGRRRFVEDRGLVLRVSVPDRAVPTLYDARAVEQILVNLLDNAAKHAADGDPPVVDVEVSAGPRQAVLSVADRGPGMQPSEAAAGTGLTRVRELTRAMHGTIVIRTREGGGTDVRITLPLADAPRRD